MASPLARLAGPALDAARRALRALDGDQVPADLRRVAGHSGALPPPLAGALLRGLDRYEWLRDKALEAWPEAESPEADADLGALFLKRPPGWTERLAAAVAAAVEADSGAHERDAAARIAELERAAAGDRMRVREVRRRADEERARLVAQRDEARGAARAARGEEGRIEAAHGRRARQAEQRAEGAEAELGAARREIAELRETLVVERRRRAAVEHSLAEAAAAGRGWVTGDDPETLAALLDDVARMARPSAAFDTEWVDAPEPLVLPGGVAPDSAAAVDWLLARRRATTVIVDGYNAGFALAGRGDPAAARRRLGLVVNPLPRLALGPLRVLVVYDSPLGDDEETLCGGRVATCFAAGSADDEIVALAVRQQGDVVVISGDRAVREGAEEAGALSLWSGALAEWANRRW